MLSSATVIFLLASMALRYPAEGLTNREQDIPAVIVRLYLEAIQARDPETAYGYISNPDQRVQDRSTYVRSQLSFTGFAQELARRLAADMDVWVIEQSAGLTKAHLEVGYRIPTADELSSRLFSWNPEQLNRLSRAEQLALSAAVENLKKKRNKITLEGRESIDLLRQADGWKIFLDWKSRATVNFKTRSAGTSDLAIEFLRRDFLVKVEEPFQVDFRVSNRTNRIINARLHHQFAPPSFAGNIDMIACGLLAPLRLGPRETRNLSSSYLLRGRLPTQKSLTIIYDFMLN
jgi:hypothetical protein